MFKISDIVKNKLMDDSGLLSQISELGQCSIIIFSGPEPASANDAILPNSYQLCEITGEGLGNSLQFESSVSNGFITKSATQGWKGTCRDSGIASFYRMIDRTQDNMLADPTFFRLQGSVGTVNADLLLATASLVIDQEQRIDYFTIGLPGS